MAFLLSLTARQRFVLTERLLQSLKENRAFFVIIGATAFPVYGYARATLDKDREDFKYLRKLAERTYAEPP
jgi:hypothetical protein